MTIRVDERLPIWERPRDYGGHSPDGDYIVYTQHRDSSALERSNYRRILEDVGKKAVELGQREGLLGDPVEGETQWVYTFRAGHWAVGWVEYIILKQVCPDDLVIYVGEIRARLADYPVYDEDDFSNLEHEEVCEYWSGLDLKGRIEAIKDSHADLSIFAARHDSVPDDSHLYDWLRG